MVRRSDLQHLCKDFPVVKAQFEKASEQQDVLEKIKNEDVIRNKDSKTRVWSKHFFITCHIFLELWYSK